MEWEEVLMYRSKKRCARLTCTVFVSLGGFLIAGPCLAQDVSGDSEPGLEPGVASTPGQDAPGAKEKVKVKVKAPVSAVTAPHKAGDESKPRDQIKACLAAQPRGPSLAAIRKGVIRHAGVSRKAVDRAMSSERLKGLLPRIHVLGLTTSEETTSASTLKDYMYKSWPYKEKLNGSAMEDRYYFGGMMSFDLSTLALGGKRLKALEAVKYRNGLVHKVNDLYYKRQGLRLRLCGQQLSYFEQQMVKLRIARLTSLLDGLTGGLLVKKSAPGVPSISTTDL